MDRININLLPPELKEFKNRERRKSLIVRVSVGLLALMIVLTGSLLSAVVLQNVRISNANKRLEETKNEVNSYKEAEAIAVVLRTRIDGINTLMAKEFPQAEAFNLVNSLTPDQVRIFSFSINKTNKLALQGETNSTQSLSGFFNSLIDPKFNEGRISKVVVDSLNRDRSSRIRFDLSITLKK